MTSHDRLAPLSPSSAWQELLRSIASACLQGIAAFLAGWARAVTALVPPWRPIFPKAVRPPPFAEVDGADVFAPTMPCAFYDVSESAARDASSADARCGTPQLPA
ncbi:MAG TPA: hypothetical protein VIO33_04755 [Burkholderiaceae bacterium]